MFVPWVTGTQISVGSLLRQGRQAVQVPGTRALLGPQKPLEWWAAGAQLTQQGQAQLPGRSRAGWKNQFLPCCERWSGSHS